MIRDRLSHTRVDDSGFSIIEVIVASGIFLLILLAVLSTLDSGTKAERTSQARHDALLELRGALTQMTKELRQAASIDPTKSNQTRLEWKTLPDNGGVQHDIVYEVVGSAPNAILQKRVDGGTPAQLADRIVAPNAFCYQFDDPDCLATTPTANLSSIRISISLSPVIFSGGSITLATDVQLRNY